MNWKDVLEFLKNATPQQLDKPVLGFIDGEICDAFKIKISSNDDEWCPNQIYLEFD